MDKFKHKGSSKIIPVSVGSRLKMNTFLVDCDDDVDDEDVTRKFLLKRCKKACCRKLHDVSKKC